MMPNLVDPEGKVLVSPDGDKAIRTDDPNVRPERDQPSPVRSDGELYNMIDPGTGLDQGGNPLMEGTLAQDDNGWLPDSKRDEYYSHKESSVYDFSDPDPTHTFIVDNHGRVYAASGNADYDAIAAQHGINTDQTAQGQVLPDGTARLDQNGSDHDTAKLEQMLEHYLQRQTQLTDAQDPDHPNRVPQYTTPHQVSSPTFARSLYAEPYEGLWEKKAEAVVEPEVEHLPHQVTVVPSPSGIHNATVRHLGFLDARVNGLPARSSGQEIMDTYGPGGPLYGHPVVVSTHDPDHLPAAYAAVEDHLKGPSPEVFKSVVRAMKNGSVAAPPGIDMSTVKVSFLPALAPLAEAGAGLVGRVLLGQAVGGLVKGAFGGQGDNQAGPQIPIDQSTQTLGAVDRGLTNDGFTESEDGDTHQFDDGDMSPSFQNPNLDEDGGATKGEDNTHKSGFSDNSPGLSRAEELLEKLIHFYHSDKSGAGDDELRDLDDLLESESPGYKDNPDQDAVHKVFLILKSPEGISHHEKPSEKKGSVLSDNHQGPVTDEQRAAVSKLLQSQGREAEIPTMLQQPWQYAKELAEVTQDAPRPNNIDPETNPQAPPPPAQMDPSAQMPVPDPSQSMMAPLSKRWSKVVRESGIFDNVDRGSYEELSPSEQKQVRRYWLRAKSRGPQLNWTPGMAGRGILIAGVPHTWNTYDPTDTNNQDFGLGHNDYVMANSHPALADFHNAIHINPDGTFEGGVPHRFEEWEDADPRLRQANDTYTFAHKEAAPNPVAVPAADQTVQDATQNRIDSTHTWQDTNGQPLIEGQVYTVHNPAYQIPDVNRIVHIKPESLVVENVGQYSNAPGVDPEENAPIVHQHEITRQEVEMEGLTFEPGDPQAQDDQNANDPSLQATSANRDWLFDDEDDMSREAGVKFTPNEQREFIDEQGVARNADKLDLAGTHYEREKKRSLLDDSFLW